MALGVRRDPLGDDGFMQPAHDLRIVVGRRAAGPPCCSTAVASYPGNLAVGGMQRCEIQDEWQAVAGQVQRRQRRAAGQRLVRPGPELRPGLPRRLAEQVGVTLAGKAPKAWL